MHYFADLLYHGMVRHRPVFIRIIHHEIDENWQQATEYSSAHAYLPAVYFAVPSSAPMHQLVPQNVKAVK